MIKKHFFLFALTLLFAGCGSIEKVWDASKPVAYFSDYKVSEKTLANGLKVIVKEDHRAPVVVSQIWYKVGSSYEHTGITGVSHVLEHMMFKGTKKHPPGEFSKIIAENGGRENAFTGRDYTAYFQQLEKRRLPISFELEADRMRNVIVLEEEFKKEIQVVMEERRMRTEDKPQALTSEQFNATAYVNSPYHWPVIGWMNDLQNMTVEDLVQWYRTWYAPNNATLVVVGDVHADEVFSLAKHYFADIQSSVLVKRKPRVEIQQKGIKRLVVKAPAQVPFMLMGYQTPSVVEAKQVWEPYALEVLAAVLDGGISARMEKHLVREQRVAASIGAGYDAFTPGRELFTFSGTPSQGKTVKDLENAIREQIKIISTELVGDDELARVKAQVVAAKVYEKDSIFYQAMSIGMLETTGLGWQLAEQYVARINKVTKEQIKAVAEKYLVDDKLTVAVLEPQSLEVKKEQQSSAVGGSHGA
ncbi:MAG TPA: insulinase family protein [Gammaproteobacteria bacterium]|nr:insulinase family protein [Gammaproteobacteria bacterium]